MADIEFIVQELEADLELARTTHDGGAWDSGYVTALEDAINTVKHYEGMEETINAR